MLTSKECREIRKVHFWTAIIWLFKVVVLRRDPFEAKWNRRAKPAK